VSLLRRAGVQFALLFAAVIVGGILAGIGDAVIGGALDGSVLGPRSSASPIVWTAIGYALIQALRYYR
jgi:hypothetical protein